jgi:uncharacterized protein YecE (DUF72 family)
VAGRLYLGTSGFAYKEWKGPFYPPDLKDKEMLPFYATRFSTVEINYSFRRHPAETTLGTWRERLHNAGESVKFFLDGVGALGPRLGPILFQCPPSLPFDRERIERFLSNLPEGHRYAFEFRHPSWVEARDVLASRGAAWCVAETDEAPAPEGPIPAQPFAYLRLRKERYGDQDLLSWARRIRDTVASGCDVFCYFKHEDKGAGAIYAERMADLVSG